MVEFILEMRPCISNGLSLLISSPVNVPWRREPEGVIALCPNLHSHFLFFLSRHRVQGVLSLHSCPGSHLLKVSTGLRNVQILVRYSEPGWWGWASPGSREPGRGRKGLLNRPYILPTLRLGPSLSPLPELILSRNCIWSRLWVIAYRIVNYSINMCFTENF